MIIPTRKLINPLAKEKIMDESFGTSVLTRPCKEAEKEDNWSFRTRRISSLLTYTFRGSSSQVLKRPLAASIREVMELETRFTMAVKDSIS